MALLPLTKAPDFAIFLLAYPGRRWRLGVGQAFQPDMTNARLETLDMTNGSLESLTNSNGGSVARVTAR